MLHLDLSFNRFSLQEGESISLALEENHTLIGFHFEGHHGYVDNKGFLVVQDIKLR